MAFRIEIATMPIVGMRRQRLSGGDPFEVPGMLGEAPIEESGVDRAAEALFDTGHRFSIERYDLPATRTGLPLATSDGKLRRAARTAGVGVLSP
jgi:hypothetical protein